METKIAIQGIVGSFHHQVAQEYYDQDVVVDECLSFDELVDSLLSGKSDQAVMAIENSIAGPIIPNYALIDKNNFFMYFPYHYSNAMLLKIMCGCTSDNIKGVERLGEDTLIKHFPKIKA